MSQLQPFLCKASTKSQASQIPRKRYKPNGSVTATPLKPITVAPVTLVTLLRSKGGGDERHRPPPGPNPTQSISSCVSAREPSRDCHEQNSRIDIEPAGLGRRGQLYRVHYEGTVLVERTRVPEFDAARALLAKGIVGQVEVWRCGASFPAMRFHCELAAKLTVEESAKSGPRFISWHPRSEDASTNAVLRRAGTPERQRRWSRGTPSRKETDRSTHPTKLELCVRSRADGGRLVYEFGVSTRFPRRCACARGRLGSRLANIYARAREARR